MAAVAMTDDLVARLRDLKPETPVLDILARLFEAADEIERLREAAKGRLAVVNAAEARVRELEEELAELEHGVSDLVEEADYHSGMRAAAEARVRELEAELAETYERAAKVAETEGAYPELNVWAGGPEWYRHGLRIAAAIRNLAQEVKHEAE